MDLNEAQSNVISLFEKKSSESGEQEKAARRAHSSKNSSCADRSADQFEEVMCRNKERLRRLRESRTKANRSVIRAYKLRK